MAINIRKRDEGDSPDDPEDGDQAPLQDQAAAPQADPFVENSADAATWIANNWEKLAGGAAFAVVAGIVAYVAYGQYRAGMVEASTSWGEAVERFERPVSGSEYMSSIRETDFNLPDDLVYESLDTKWKEINDRAKKTLDAYPKSVVAGEAHLTRAAAAYRLGNYENSVEHYQTYLDDKPSEEMKPVVYLGAGLAHGASGNVEKAASMFTKLADANSDYEVLALYHKGMIHEEAGNLKKAKELYKQALDSGSSSPYHTDIKRRRTLLSVREE